MENCGELWGISYFTLSYYNKVNDTFLGNIEVRADAKGRVFIPVYFQEATASCFRRETYYA